MSSAIQNYLNNNLYKPMGLSNSYKALQVPSSGSNSSFYNSPSFAAYSSMGLASPDIGDGVMGIWYMNNKTSNYLYGIPAPRPTWPAGQNNDILGVSSDGNGVSWLSNIIGKYGSYLYF